MTVGAAVRAHEVLRFDYDGGSDTRLPRRAEAHHLVTWGGRWYLVGYDLDRADWRTYRVDRMTPKTGSGPRFAPRPLPATDVAAFVAERFSTVNPWPCRGEAEVDMAAVRGRPVGRPGRPGRAARRRPLPRRPERLVVGRRRRAVRDVRRPAARASARPELADAMHRLADRLTARSA